MAPDHFIHGGPGLELEARRVPWDSEALGCPVAEITTIRTDRIDGAEEEFDRFQVWLREYGYCMVSCRLPHEKLVESALLERNHFRFIEMVLHPEILNLRDRDLSGHGIEICEAKVRDAPAIGRMAESTFGVERFHVDPLLTRDIANARYRRWVESSAGSKTQILLKAILKQRIIGFFLVEYRDRQVYWHLTAIAHEMKGMGLGERVWKAMMSHHQENGMQSILTTISARNVAVLNLYSKLNFRFRPPEMTFHWVSNTFKV